MTAKPREQYAKFLKECYNGQEVDFGALSIVIHTRQSRFGDILRNVQIKIEVDSP